MQLALTPEVLFPLGACAVVAVAVIAVVVVLVRGKRPDDTLVPTQADWTGEAATADPAPAAHVTVPALPERLTVAQAIAVRDADTAPLPVSSVGFLGAGPVAAVPVPDPVEADPERVPPRAADGPPEAESSPSGPTEVDPAPADAAPSGPQATAAEVATPAPPTSPALRVAAETAGSGPTVAAAVAHALAARAGAGSGAPPVMPNRTADARDRLLAVLLADPARAVGAAEELATCRGQLGEVLGRLVSSGLTTDQLSRLSGFSVEQVSALLAQQGASR